jgi:hypothetical protein
MKTATLSPELLLKTETLSRDLLHKMDAYWRAARNTCFGRGVCLHLGCCQSPRVQTP